MQAFIRRMIYVFKAYRLAFGMPAGYMMLTEPVMQAAASRAMHAHVQMVGEECKRRRSLQAVRTHDQEGLSRSRSPESRSDSDELTMRERVTFQDAMGAAESVLGEVDLQDLESLILWCRGAAALQPDATALPLLRCEVR